MIELIPVLELDPGTYRTRERPLPAAEDRRGWFQYWRDCLADSGISGLEPLNVGHHLVKLDDLNDAATIRIIASREIGVEGFTPESVTRDAVEWTALYGGYVLRRDDVSIWPTCCGRLYDLANWRMAAAHRLPEWATVWIGHPWTAVRYFEESLCFSEYFESESTNQLQEVLCLKPQELEASISRAEASVLAFRGRLRAVLADLLPEERTADWLARRWTAMDDIEAAVDGESQSGLRAL